MTANLRLKELEHSFLFIEQARSHKKQELRDTCPYSTIKTVRSSTSNGMVYSWLSY